MKRIVKTILSVVIASGIVTSAIAADVDENPPDGRRAVENILKALGDPHWPEQGMKVTEVGTVETEKTFYHIYSGYLKDEEEYRCIIFDNTPTYIGYYQFKYEAQNVEENCILIYNEDEPSSGNDNDGMIRLPLTDKGPPRSTTIGMSTSEFTKAPQPEVEEPAEDSAEASDDPGTKIETPAEEAERLAREKEEEAKKKKEAKYREWNLTFTSTNRTTGETVSKNMPVMAKFIEMEGRNKIVIMSAKNGRTTSIPITSLSAEDKAYLQEFLSQ